MAPPPTIFISAVGKELKSARQLVANTLKFLGYESVWLDILGTEQGDPCGMLRQQIDQCAGVVQLVGLCYGGEPPMVDEGFGRVSYTHYEALHAEQRGKKVWYFLLQEDFPTDVPHPESDDLHELQAEYRERLQTEPRMCYSVGSCEALEASVLKLCNDLGRVVRKRGNLAGRLTASLRRRGERADQKIARSKTLVRKEPIQPIRDEDVQFSAYRPRTVYAGKWHTWLIFAYRGRSGPDEPDPAIEVERQARAVLGAEFDDGKYVEGRQESAVALPRESTITIIPEVTGLKFNPPQRSFVWQEPVHREEFRASASPDLVGRTLRGRITVFLGALLLAEINVTVVVLSAAEGAANGNLESRKPVVSDRARVYRKIFASYSRRDRAVVDHLEKLAKALGDRYLRDIHDIRSGEIWSHRLEEMIREADVFQLFWSSNSMRSKYVRQEWEYALALERPNFIRPTYWESPLPSDPALSLPPDSLRILHFQRLPISSDNQRPKDSLPVARRRSSRKLPVALSTLIILIGVGVWTLQQQVVQRGASARSEMMPLRAAASARKDWLTDRSGFLEAETKLKAARESKLGSTYFKTLRDRYKLAEALRQQNRYADAEAEHRAVLNLREKALGPEHRATLASRNSLARTLVNAGKYAEAERELRPLIEITERILRRDDPLTLASRDILGEALAGQGKLVKAEHLFREVLARADYAFGVDHPIALAAAYHLALCLKAEGQLASAKVFAQRAAEGASRGLGPTHPDAIKYEELWQELQATK